VLGPGTGAGASGTRSSSFPSALLVCVCASAACGGRHRCGQYTASSDSSYAWASGTSMAVPHVAGVAALYLSLHKTASAQELKDALLATARYPATCVATIQPTLLLSRGIGLTTDAGG
jgi:subtilisin family serine protease